jgi:hypothetical protein
MLERTLENFKAQYIKSQVFRTVVLGLTETLPSFGDLWNPSASFYYVMCVLFHS